VPDRVGSSMTICRASNDHSAGARVCTRSLRYVGIAVARTLWAVSAILYVIRCLTGRQCSDSISVPHVGRRPSPDYTEHAGVSPEVRIAVGRCNSLI